MITNQPKKISLATLLTGLVTLSVVLTLSIVLLASYKSKKQSLIDTILILNYSSAVKMSQTIDSLFTSMRSSLRYSASILSKYTPAYRDDAVHSNLELLRHSSNYFNSLVVVDETGVVRAVSAETDNIAGNHISTREAKKALASKKPYVSHPYITTNTKRLIVFMSEPIFDMDGIYRGFIGGSIYLQENNILNMIFGSNPTEKTGSSFYIVSSNGHLLFHRDKSRLGEDLSADPVVRLLNLGKSGLEQVVDLSGEDVLAGYVKVPGNCWGVVVVSPISVVNKQLYDHIQTILLFLLPPFALLVLLVVWLARKLARPIVDLADLVSKIGSEDVQLPEEKQHWNREANLLTEAIRYAFLDIKKRTDQLTLDAMTDLLTGLPNRRTLETIMLKWIQEQTPFSIIIMDIDRFKFINDTYGHPAGDEVLKHFANMITQLVRPDDICCRFGGEEFIVLLANADVNDAYKTAERIRTNLEKSDTPIGQPITVSLGIANYSLHSGSVEELIHTADKALYQAKESGRNQTIVADQQESSL
ncbi:diguanylate cyclase [Brevibacillus sp. B_LB10_24]|uniref:sensor domain-containing diguanylate cyclase n=1 Tax=Brevibacillus sp. B_LB10_24 TaxID=3380645 RepID=UPI0038BBC6F7